MKNGQWLVWMGLVVLTAAVLAGCAAGRAAESGLSAVRIDLQDGLAGQAVAITIGEETVLKQDLPGAVPMKGPLRTLDTTLPPGVHDMVVEWGPETSAAPRTLRKSVTVLPGEPLFIALQLNGETLTVTIQETPFLYF